MKDMFYGINFREWNMEILVVLQLISQRQFYILVSLPKTRAVSRSEDYLLEHTILQLAEK